MSAATHSTRVAGFAIALGLGVAVATGGVPIASADDGTTPDKQDTQRPERPIKSPLGAIRDLVQQSRTTVERSLGLDSESSSPKLDQVSKKLTDRTLALDIPKALQRSRDLLQAGQADGATTLPAQPKRDLPDLPKLADLTSPPRLEIPRVKLDRLTKLPETVSNNVTAPIRHEISSATNIFTAPAEVTSFVGNAPQRALVTTPPQGNFMQRVLGALGSLGSNSAFNPGQNNAPENPLGWVVLAWVRRQFFNTAPQSETPVDMVGNTVVLDADDLDGDDLTYTIAQGPATGTVLQDPTDPSKFTYTGEGDTSFTVTVSDADSGWHFHGLQGFFAPDGGHTKTVVVNVPAQTHEPTPPTVTELPIDLTGTGYTGSGSSFVGSNNTAVQYATGGTAEDPIYALAIRGADGQVKVVDLGGAPAEGQNPLITDTAVVQTIKRTDGSYAVVVVPTGSTAAPLAFREASLTTLDAPPDSYTEDLDGQPIGFATPGKDGIVYQVVDTSGSGNGVYCMSTCKVAVIDTNRVSEADYEPTSVDVPDLVIPGFNTTGGTKWNTLAVDNDGNLYVTSINPSTGDSGVTIVSPTGSANTIPLDGYATFPQVVIGPDGKGYISTVDAAKMTSPDPANPSDYGAQMAIITAGPTPTVQYVALAEGVPTGPVAISNGNVYQPVAVPIAPATPGDPPTYQTIVWAVPVGGGTATPINAGDAYPYGPPVVGSDGTVYQPMVHLTPGPIVPANISTAIIKPGSTQTIDLGGPYDALEFQMIPVAGGSQVYQVVSSIDETDSTGVTKVYRLSGATPGTPVATIDEASVKASGVAAPDGTLYFATRNSNGDVTIWSLAPGSNTPLGTPFEGEGDPTAFEVAPDGHVYLTTKSTDGTQSWVYAVDTAQSITV